MKVQKQSSPDYFEVHAIIAERTNEDGSKTMIHIVELGEPGTIITRFHGVIETHPDEESEKYSDLKIQKKRRYGYKDAEFLYLLKRNGKIEGGPVSRNDFVRSINF